MILDLAARFFQGIVAIVPIRQRLKVIFHGRANVMKTYRRGYALWCAGLLIGLGSGCQTWVPEIGMTLPSPNYLKHQPQYIPPSPPYPLPRELASLEEAAAAQQNSPPAFGGN
jgi:hypothetical protein